MQQPSEPNDQDLQWHWGGHKTTGRGEYNLRLVLHSRGGSDGLTVLREQGDEEDDITR